MLLCAECGWNHVKVTENVRNDETALNLYTKNSDDAVV